MTDISDLIKELEEADYGSLSLDMKVFDTIRNHDMEMVRATPKSFTTSVDAALSLVPETTTIMLRYRMAETYAGFEGKPKAHCALDRQWWRGTEGYANTLPLAISIAALRARKEVE